MFNDLMKALDYLSDAGYKTFGNKPGWEFGLEENKLSVDIEEMDDKFLVSLEVPGLKREDISIDTENGYLLVSAKYKKEKKENGRYERMDGNYSRKFRLNEVDSSKIEAKMEDGILTLTLPKLEELKPKKIEIK